MQIVWDRGEVTVRDIYEAFRARRPIAYTTVLTTMRILEQKGHLRVSRAARAHVYQARSTRQGVLQAMVRHFVDRVFRRRGRAARAAPHPRQAAQRRRPARYCQPVERAGDGR